jgi:hypothetical protein
MMIAQKFHRVKTTKQPKIWLYKGLPLVSNITAKRLGILHNELYIVDTFDDKTITLRYQMLNFGVKYLIKRLEKRFVITYEQLSDLFSPGYAFTTYKTEGQTISYPHSIYEFNRMPTKTSYTAITRTTDSKLITIKNVDKMKGNLLDIIADSKNVAYIYKITDGKQIYIGSTLDMERRWEEHKEASQSGTSKLYKYIRENRMTTLKWSA